MAIGILCLILTRWPVAGVLGTVASATLPGKLRKVVPGAGSKRAEAVAAWTELIRDSLAASAGLAQAIVVTASSAPLPIRPQVGALATRLANGVSLETALRAFALDVDEPAAEFLVCALLLAATSRAQKLVDVLSALVDSIREDVSMHLRVDASRAAARSSVRTVVLFSLGFAFTLTVVAHSYLSPFGTPAGQVVLAVVGLFYAIGLMLMVQLVRPAAEMRLLDAERVE
jgi:Flp pilus assembly protein TadB